MTKIKLCGLTRPCDIETANELRPDYVGFVFYQKSRRFVTPERAAELRRALLPGIRAVGVFVNEEPEAIAELMRRGIIDLAQAHGGESEDCIRTMMSLCGGRVIQAFRVASPADIERAEKSAARHVLLDSGPGGTGSAFDWPLAAACRRPYFLAGGLTPGTVGDAVRTLRPYAVDVSSGIETDGVKDPVKMRAFVRAVRERDGCL